MMLPVLMLWVVGSAAQSSREQVPLRGLPEAPRGTSRVDLQKGKDATQHVLSLIYNRYEMFDESKYGAYLILPYLNIDEHAWDLMKYKYALKILTGEDFLAIFGGSSVTAGHDNYLNESYPMVYARRMEGPLKALGIRLEVRNIAMGGMGCFPQNLCYESQGGDDADLYSWEQSYFCKVSPEKAMSAMSAVWSNRHALYMEHASGSLGFSYCPSVRDNLPHKQYTDSPPYSDEFWTPASAGLKEWKPTSADVEKYRTFNAKHSSSGGYFSKQLGSQVAGSWNIMPNCILPNKSAKCSQVEVIANFCDGLHFINKEANRYHPTGKGAAHHPSSGVHLMKGESVSWYHAMILLDAIYMVEKDFERGETAEKQIKEYRKVLDALAPRTPLNPPPTECEKYHCQYKLECYNDYRPKWNYRLSLRDLVVRQDMWGWINNSLSEWQIKGQYLDTRVEYICQDEKCGALSIVVRVSTVSEAILSGSFEGARFFVDLNVPQAKRKNYQLPATLNSWPDVQISDPKHMNIATLRRLPTGDHVLSIAPGSFSKPISVSHLMVWI